ncbi:uncharacterized protein LOC134274056 isoform X2 [Saccostrea cucullata]|uniref:uncharacterized protein LOC134274056 isoform X2 n=1 Tax=Saccostrea cuccullata TaxID=36930 RepID=UPI002ED26CB1
MSKTYAFLPELKKVVKCRIDREEEKRDVNSVPEAPRVPTHKTYGEKQAVSSHSRLKTPYNKFEPYTPDPDYPGAKEI